MSEFLKCDAPGCDHREDVDAIREEHVDKPCPKCGANLLTRSDWNVYVAMFRPMIAAMKAAGMLVDATSASDAIRISINYHDGTTTIKEIGSN